jgi:Flp pilus assembly protein TadD
MTLLLCELAVAVYWFHPLAWLARREARLNGERACDDLVIGDGTKPSVYAAHLLGIVRSFTPGARTALPVMAMARPSQFEGRMRAILDPGLHRRGPSRGQVRAAALGLFTSVIVLSALQPWAPRTAEGAAIPNGLDSSAGVFPMSGQRARAKAPCKQATPRSAAKNKCPKKPASTPPPAAIAFAPPVVNPAGFVRALARLTTPAPAPAPEAAPSPEMAVGPAAPAPMPAGIVLASNRHDRSGEDWYDRGMDLHRSGRYDQAIAAFGKAIELGYREDAATYNTACAYALKGDKDHAVEWLHKAMDAGFSVSGYITSDDDLDSLRSDPRFTKLREELKAHHGSKELEEARSARTRYERLAGRAKAPKDAYFSSARDLLNTGEYALAAKAYQRSAELGYRVGTSYYNAACALAQGGDKPGALDSLQKSLENGFDDPSLFSSDDDLASLHGNARFQKLETLAEDLQMPTVRWGAKIFRSSERKEWREATKEAREVVAKYPNLGRSWFNLGFTELRAERPEAAVEAFQKALQLSYRKPTTLYNLACSYAKAGQKDKAFEFLFQSLDAGFDEGSTLAHDEDLDSLHGDARFKKAKRILEGRGDED